MEMLLYLGIRNVSVADVVTGLAATFAPQT